MVSYDDVMFREMDELMQKRTVNDEYEEQIYDLYHYHSELDSMINCLSDIAEDFNRDMMGVQDRCFITDHILDAINALYVARDTCWDGAKFLEELMEGEE